MTVYLSLEQLLALHAMQVGAFGGARGLRDRGRLEAAAARPRMTFGGEDLYPDLAAKAAALMHSLVMNHPFADGNKRVGVMAAELFLAVNGWELDAADDDLVAVTVAVARGEMTAEALAIWIRQRSLEREDPPPAALPRSVRRRPGDTLPRPAPHRPGGGAGPRC